MCPKWGLKLDIHKKICNKRVCVYDVLDKDKLLTQGQQFPVLCLDQNLIYK